MTVSAIQSQPQSVGGGDSGIYTVRRGDTLSEIAQRHGVSLSDLIRANPQIANPDLIFPDQRIALPGGSSPATPVEAGQQAGGVQGNAYQLAAQYLGRDASELKHDRALGMNPNVPNDVCCANFVSSVLRQAGQLPPGVHTDSVAQLNTILRDRGWTPVSPQDARPGDVVIIRGGGVSHTEIYAGNGRMIGSNNVNADGSQRISENNLSWALRHDAVILRAPAGTPGTGGGQTVGGPAPTAPVAGPQRVEGPALSLSAQDIEDLKKTLQTEWVQSAGDAQAHGIIDTILNRTASGRWGGSVADVVNAYNQFSDINGPVSRRQGRNSVEDIPDSRISARVDQLVNQYLAERAAGRPSSVGSHLNYANPNYSDARNLGWINRLDGPVLGRGDAIHRHGTVPELERFRPQPFAVILPGTPR